MEENKLPNDNEINNEKQKLQQEVKRLDIYKNCNDCELDKFLRYFPNRATEIADCFREEEGKNVLQPEKKGQLQKIIMDGLCSLFEPYIQKGYQVLQLDKDLYHPDIQKFIICLKAPENYKHIGISIGQKSKLVFTNGEWKNKINTGKGYKNKLCLFPASGVQQMNYNDEDNNFHNEIKIFDGYMGYTLIIYPDTKDIKIIDFNKGIEYAEFCDKKNEIFKDKDEIIPFFSTLSFTETEQVLQILNKHLKNFNIKTVLKEIKYTIEENRKEEKKNENNDIDNKIIYEIKKGPNEQKEDNDFNSEDKKRGTEQKPKIEKEDGICCECCITCLKQCWSPNKIEK